MKSTGKVFLVGAGPGDPGLFTLRGWECLKQAEVVIYDSLCNPCLLRLAPHSAEKIFAGKHTGQLSVTQSRIDQLMLNRARRGKQIVRLKGGDPFVFGRGGEESTFLQKHKIPFEIVPGITSAIAVPAYAGIPVTHRDYSSGVAIVTARENPEKDHSLIDYPSLVKFPGTLVFLMGVKLLRGVIEKLLASGKPARTPIAMVRWGTRGLQQTLTGQLGNIADRAEKIGFRPPAVVVIGDVVRCRTNVMWFEKRPLLGRRIVLTRSLDRVGVMGDGLRKLGAEVLELPTIELKPIHDDRVKTVVRSVQEFQWVFFASGYAVDLFLDHVLKEHGDLRILSGIQLGVVGHITAQHLVHRGLKADVIPSQSGVQALIDVLKKNKNWKNQKVLLPRSEIGRTELHSELIKWGAKVQSVAFYRNTIPKWTWELEALQRIGADSVVFTSSSTVDNWMKILKRSRSSKTLQSHLSKAKMIAIGPSTAVTLKKYGLKVHAMPLEPSVNGLCQILKK